jgi:hypothetical protein
MLLLLLLLLECAASDSPFVSLFGALPLATGTFLHWRAGLSGHLATAAGFSDLFPLAVALET